ncbi:MAG: glycosyltransferase family 39 protein [Thermomicrobiales bacterium]
MTANALDENPASVLDRTIDLTAVSRTTIGWIALTIFAFVVRVAQLDLAPLAPAEARRAFEAFSLYRGDTTGPGNHIGTVEPVFLLLRSLGFFLFGGADVSARIVSALLGVLLVVAIAGLSPFVGPARALGMGALAAVSPTLVYSSRLVDPQIAVAAFALIFVVSLLRIGLVTGDEHGRRRWALASGVALAATIGSSPSSLSVLIAIIAGLAAAIGDRARTGAVRRAMEQLKGTPGAPIFAAAGFVVTLLAAYSRLFTDFRALSGLGSTITGWARLLTTASVATPTQFFLLAILLYEILAVVFAIVGVVRTGGEERDGALPWVAFGVWFTVALLLFSFSSGGAPEHAIHVALPLVLLGGGELGAAIARVDRRELRHGRAGLLLLAIVGFVIALLAFLVLVGRVGHAADQTQAIFEAAAAALIALFPLGYAIYGLSRSLRAGGLGRQIPLMTLLAFTVFLAAFTLRSSIELSFYHPDDGVELLSQRTSTPAVDAIVNRVRNLSRDTTLLKGSARDPQGGHGLTVSIDQRTEWPLRWYLRDFPDAQIAASGQAIQNGAQVAIAPDDKGMAEAGYAVKAYSTVNRVPGTYLTPKFGAILKDVVLPSHWVKGAKYLLFREMATAAVPETIAVGITGELSNQITPNTGPFGLFGHVGSGNGRGQFNQPRGIAASADGQTIYVVDMGNARVERFAASGDFIGSWGEGDGKSVTFATTSDGLGPTGIAVGRDGLVYVCDTWNHRVVVLGPDGQLAREFGAFKDTQNSADASVDPGMFFGPRAIAVTGDEIYVVDTGNERVQVFGLDGTFRRAFGGFGSAPNQLKEPVGIAVGQDGRVFVADSANGRISVFSSTGAPLAQWPVDSWKGKLYFEPYLALDDRENLYASSSATGSVDIYDPGGALLDTIRQVGKDRLEQPVGIAATGDGTVLISDKGSDAVLQYVPAEPQTTGSGDGTLPGAASPAAVIDPAGSNLPASPSASPAASPIAQASPDVSPTAGSTPRG